MDKKHWYIFIERYTTYAGVVSSSFSRISFWTSFLGDSISGAAQQRPSASASSTPVALSLGIVMVSYKTSLKNEGKDLWRQSSIESLMIPEPVTAFYNILIAFMSNSNVQLLL